MMTAKFLRRKLIEPAPGNLLRKLGLFDLMGLGIGATLGAGVYVLTGVIARTEAGPGIVVSFMISGFASILSGLCYAEFGARVPRAGSAYVYSYVTVGELLAWTTGWQLLLEYVIGASSVARSWSGYVDSLANGAISAGLTRTIGTWAVPGLAADPDFLAAGMTMLLSMIVSFGVRESTSVNNVLTSINVLVIIFVIIAGSFYADRGNIGPKYGGFAPMGVTGIFKGAATSFYAYVGFDVIATSAEEVINPAKVIPTAIISSLVICACAYMGVSAVVTLMVPWSQLDVKAPLAAAFAGHGAEWARYIIAVGAVAGLSTSLMTCIFPMPRIIYAIAEDGLLPPWIGKVHPRFNTPVVATMLCGAFAATMALIFDIDALADMMSIGTLMSYTLVAASVLVLRYMEDDGSAAMRAADAAGGEGESGASVTLSHPEPDFPRQSRSFSAGLTTLGESLLSKCADGEAGSPDRTFYGRTPAEAAGWLISTYCLGVAVASVSQTVVTGSDLGQAAAVALYVGIAVGLVMALVSVVLLLAVPSKAPVGLSFTCPGMPWTPLLSMAINVYLLISLSPFTWIRFAVWCVVGGAIYFLYGIKHSKAPDLPVKGARARGAGGAEVAMTHFSSAGGGKAGLSVTPSDWQDDEGQDASEASPLTGARVAKQLFTSR